MAPQVIIFFSLVSPEVSNAANVILFVPENTWRPIRNDLIN
jgi:hypothetical protein